MGTLGTTLPARGRHAVNVDEGAAAIDCNTDLAAPENFLKLRYTR